MTRDHKVGLAVTCTFLCLSGTVAWLKFQEKSPLPPKPAEEELTFALPVPTKPLPPPPEQQKEPVSGSGVTLPSPLKANEPEKKATEKKSEPEKTASEVVAPEKEKKQEKAAPSENKSPAPPGPSVVSGLPMFSEAEKEKKTPGGALPAAPKELNAPKTMPPGPSFLTPDSNPAAMLASGQRPNDAPSPETKLKMENKSDKEIKTGAKSPQTPSLPTAASQGSATPIDSSLSNNPIKLPSNPSSPSSGSTRVETSPTGLTKANPADNFSPVTPTKATSAPPTPEALNLNPGPVTPPPPPPPPSKVDPKPAPASTGQALAPVFPGASPPSAPGATQTITPPAPPPPAALSATPVPGFPMESKTDNRRSAPGVAPVSASVSPGVPPPAPPSPAQAPNKSTFVEDPLPNGTPAPSAPDAGTGRTPPPSTPLGQVQPGDMKLTPVPGGTTGAGVMTASAVSGRPQSPLSPSGLGTPSRSTPQVASWTETLYQCTAEDTFEKLSQRFYKTEALAGALRAYNKNHPSASELLHNKGELTAGETVFIPAQEILEERHGDLIRKVPPAPLATAPSGGQGTRP
jgi:hypothetical protein